MQALNEKTRDLLGDDLEDVAGGKVMRKPAVRAIVVPAFWPWLPRAQTTGLGRIAAPARPTKPPLAWLQIKNPVKKPSRPDGGPSGGNKGPGPKKGPGGNFGGNRTG